MSTAENPARASRRSTVSRARLYVVGGTLLSLFVAFAVFVAAWSQYAIGQRTADLARQVAVLAKGQAAADELDAAATEETRERLLRIEAGLIGAALLVTDNNGVVERSTAGTRPRAAAARSAASDVGRGRAVGPAANGRRGAGRRGGCAR